MLYLIYESCWAFMPCMGRCRISVKPTGHARSSLEFIHLFGKLKVIFKGNQLDQGWFILFILSLVVKPFLTNSQRFLK